MIQFKNILNVKLDFTTLFKIKFVIYVVKIFINVLYFKMNKPKKNKLL